MKTKVEGNIKTKLYQKCGDLVGEKITTIKAEISESKESASGDEKSSVGDKYETSQAMAHLEQEKLLKQLSEALKLKKVLDQIDHLLGNEKVMPGSLVFTTKGNFYISVALGKISVNSEFYFAVSATSPISKKLMNKQVGQSVELNGSIFFIDAIM